MNPKSRFCRGLVCLILLFVQNPLLSQVQHALPNTSRSFLATVGGDVAHIFTAPFRFGPQDGLKLLALTAVTAGFVTSLDEPIDDDFIERNDPWVKPGINLAKVGDVYDNMTSGGVLAALTIPMLTAGLIRDDSKLLETSRLTIESFVMAGLITQLGKRVFGRARPYTGQGPDSFDPFSFGGSRDKRSFPSGHATSAFAMMTVIAKQYPHWWVQIPAYTVAASVAWQRIDSHSHWGADVIVGSALGYYVSSSLVNRHKQQSKGWSVSPYIFGNRVGLVVGL